MNPATSVLILCDVQNDFLHRDSAYGRVGVSSAAVATLPERFTPGMRRPRAASLRSRCFSCWMPSREPMISPQPDVCRPDS